MRPKLIIFSKLIIFKPISWCLRLDSWFLSAWGWQSCWAEEISCDLKQSPIVCGSGMGTSTTHWAQSASRWTTNIWGRQNQRPLLKTVAFPFPSSCGFFLWGSFFSVVEVEVRLQDSDWASSRLNYFAQSINVNLGDDQLVWQARRLPPLPAETCSAGEGAIKAVTLAKTGVRLQAWLNAEKKAPELLFEYLFTCRIIDGHPLTARL